MPKIHTEAERERMNRIFDEHVLDSLRGVVRIAPDGVTVVDADGQPCRLEWRSGASVKRNDGLRVFLPLPIPFGRKEE